MASINRHFAESPIRFPALWSVLMPIRTPRQPQPAPLPPGSPRHARAASEPTASAPDNSSQSVLQQRLQGTFLTIIGLAGLIGGVLFSIEAPRFTPVPVVFLTFWLVMVIVGKILFAGLSKLRDAGVGAPAPQQVRAAAAVAGIVVAVGMMGFAATGTGAGVAAAAPCPGGGPATCGPTGPELTFAPPTGQATAPGQQGQQGAQQGSDGIATSPAGGGGENGPGIQAQTPDFGTPGQQAPNIPGNEPAQQPGQGQGQQQGQPAQGNGQGQQNQNPTVQTTAPGGPQQTGRQQPGQQTQSGQPSSPTVTVTKTESQCPVPGAGNGAGAPGTPGSGDSNNNGGGTGPDNGDSESKNGAPSWAYLVAEATGIMAGGRTRRRPTPGAVASQLSSETLTDTTTATKASSEYYSSAQINPSPSGDMEPAAPNTADAPPSHQPMQPPSTGSGNSGSGPSSSASPSPSTSGGQGGSVGTSPGQGAGTGSDSGSTPTPMPGSAGNNITPVNFDGPDGEGYPQPGGIPGIFSFLWPLANALAKLFQDIFNRLIKPFLDWIAEIIRNIKQFLGQLLIDFAGLIAILPDILRKYLEGIVGLIRGPERGMAPPTTGNPGTTAPTSPGDGEGGGNGDGNKPPKPTPPIVLPPGQNPGTDLPTPADPGTPLPGQPRPPITPKPTTPPDPGKIPAPGRIDPETGLPVEPSQPPAKVIPRKPAVPGQNPQPGDLDPETGQPIPLPRPKPRPERPTASSGGGQAPKPKKQPPAPTKPPPKPGSGGGPGRWEWTNESGGANVKQNRPFQEAVTGVDGAWSYVVNGVKFDGFEIIKGLVKALVDAKYGSSGYGALLKPDGTLVDVYSPSTPPFIKGIYDSLISEAQRQVAAVNALPNPQEFPIYWVANSPATAAALKAVIEQVPEAAGRITVITTDVWNALKGIG
ncbi:hypothetical protein [Tsukamurella paurometabola]|uniref:Uncharacterized protein n=1 Tax=Tsukamurella paurometabola TaxID=2061 RepID=A0ABS5NFV8_TSUPA|nr:hypothetical protein [Tsukamurella paurometabola]MBS4102910.1 hypothetical protein [Tsukamurella paurometabola]